MKLQNHDRREDIKLNENLKNLETAINHFDIDFLKVQRLPIEELRNEEFIRFYKNKMSFFNAIQTQCFESLYVLFYIHSFISLYFYNGNKYNIHSLFKFYTTIFFYCFIIL